MNNCKKCTEVNKCILHVEKSNYQTDFHKVGFLNDFYEQLFEYIIDFEEIKKYLKKDIEENYSDSLELNQDGIYLLNDTNKFKKLIKKYFEEDNLYDKIFDKELNLVKNDKDSQFNSIIQTIIFSFDEYFKNKNIVFSQIFFPTYDDRDDFNYMKLIKKLKNIYFNYCKFSTTFLELKDIKVFFQNCEFMDNYSISNSDILENQSNIIYQMCIFHKDVSISKNDEEYKINHTLFSDCQFKKDLKIEEIEFEKGVFDNTIYNKFLDINICEFRNCTINDKFILEKYKIKRLDLSESVFNNKVKIQKGNIDEAIFYNTKFKDLADFYQSKFKKVDFERTDFEKISVFSESEFNCDLDFKYVKFLGKTIFRDTVISGKLDLRNSIFNDEANFLDITSKKREKKDEQLIGEPTDIKVANRETARIIKNFYDNSNNIIEANRFYKLEMEKRREEFKNFPSGEGL